MQQLPRRKLPLVYACSGCSGGAQLAHQLAVRLDREQIAEMSCIAGLGADRPQVVALARSGRPLIALDGCPQQCVLHCLRRHGLEPTLHYDLTEFDAASRRAADAEMADARRVIADLFDVLIAGRPGAPRWSPRFVDVKDSDAKR